MKKKAMVLDLLMEDIASENLIDIKQDTIEQVPLIYTHRHIEGGFVNFFYPKIQVRRYSNAIIHPLSDFIILEKGAVWNKSRQPQFTKVIPLDRNLVDSNRDRIYVKKPEQIIDLKNAFSFCGVHSKTWSHFIVQYLPKIEYIQTIVNMIGGNITVVLPKYNDNHVRTIMYTLLKGVTGILVMEIEDDQSVRCENLFHVEHTAMLSDHASYISPSDIIIPEFALSVIKDKLVNNPAIFPNLIEAERNQYRRLFISRQGPRNLQNIAQVELFFKEQGFEIVSPDKMTLEEKRRVFSEASFIVGPHSSGFSNIIFCKPGVKALVLTNFQRVYDLYLSTLANYFKIEIFAVTGWDSQPSYSHSDYYIPLNKIEDKCKEIGIL
ncbi:MAG: glycosyltransferase family 61 protein [Bacteroidales bacterium]|nr:glycosyltransferase family 61 protein [Bacteroidales bacterium]